MGAGSSGGGPPGGPNGSEGSLSASAGHTQDRNSEESQRPFNFNSVRAENNVSNPVPNPNANIDPNLEQARFRELADVLDARHASILRERAINGNRRKRVTFQQLGVVFNKGPIGRSLGNEEGFLVRRAIPRAQPTSLVSKLVIQAIRDFKG